MSNPSALVVISKFLSGMYTEADLNSYIRQTGSPLVTLFMSRLALYHDYQGQGEGFISSLFELGQEINGILGLHGVNVFGGGVNILNTEALDIAEMQIYNAVQAFIFNYNIDTANAVVLAQNIANLVLSPNDATDEMMVIDSQDHFYRIFIYGMFLSHYQLDDVDIGLLDSLVEGWYNGTVPEDIYNIAMYGDAVNANHTNEQFVFDEMITALMLGHVVLEESFF